MNRRDFLKNTVLLAALTPLVKLTGSSEAENKIILERGRVSRKRFGNLTLPLLGFGTMRLPRKNGEIDMDAWRKLVKRAMEAGINYYDTAWFYMKGKSENAVAEALKDYPRESYMLADKLPVRSIRSKEDAERIFEEQLKKCRTGYFDFYLLHALNRRHWETVKKFDLIKFVEEKRKQGKIRYVGFSFHDTPEVLQEIVNAHKWDFVQLQINYLDWEDYRSREQYEIAVNAKLPVIVMEPLKGGTLAKVPENVRKMLTAIHPGTTPAQWAFRYVGSLDNVVTVLSGMSAMEHLEENIRTFSPFRKVVTRDKRILESAISVYRNSKLIPCTDCRYCIPCPADVNIPGIFRAYNNFKIDGDMGKLKKTLADMSAKEEGLDACVKCGACLKKCPQQIKITEQFDMISALLKGAK